MGHPPTPFFGYSDNTNLLNRLWTHGAAGYHGGSTMVHLARGDGVEPEHAGSLRAALFEPVEAFSDEELSWDNLASGRWIRPAENHAGSILLLETSHC